MQQDTKTNIGTRRGLSNLLVPLFVIVACGVAYYFTTQFDRVPPILKRGIQPSDFPQLVLGLIASLSALLAIRDTTPALPPMNKLVWGTIIALVGFIFVAEIDLFLALGIFAAVLTALWGERRWIAILFVGLIVPLIVFFLFDSIFEVRFPRGLLTNIWYG